ncbi:SAYSVFN motif domain containing 1 [Rhynchophorus ferrugineus]|uniref:SAYSVFN motif domain containing 1 n=1 Tax=Rhynchophorus ferrugineus TaxID=354439 RepID=UPI003FCD44F6
MTITETEKKLAAYRARKNREALLNHYKAQVKTMFSKVFPKNYEKPEDTNVDIKEPLLTESQDVMNLHEANSDSDIESNLEEDEKKITLYDYTYYILCFILWLTIYAIFVKLQFGTIYFIVSLLIGIYFNTRTGPKKKDEISAYSVFNKNCESIKGTLNAEQLTRQMVYGGFR